MASDYRQQVERALHFIGQHLERPLTIAEVAKVAHLSEFHFHRIFSAVMGEPIGRYISRRRLEVSALRLAYEPQRSVSEIADSCGFSSVSNFSKAFSAYFGCSPSRLRNPDPALPAAIGKLTRSYAKEFHPSDLYQLPKDGDPQRRTQELAQLTAAVRYRECPGISVACLASPEGYDFEALAETWAELIARAHQLGLSDGPVDAYGMAFDSPKLTAPQLCRYHACVPCPVDFNPPAPLFRSQIPAGRYAVFPYAGPVDEVENMYRRLYSIWLPESSLTPDDFVPIDHYVNDAPRDGFADFEIWIKVRPRD
jgi:AraC family transcriptional regulator